MPINLSKYILATIVYYDIFNYPLTPFEIWKYLITYGVDQYDHLGQEDRRDGFSLYEIFEELEGKNLKGKLKSENGFYFLPGREKLAGQRIKRSKISEIKFKTIRKVVFFLRFAPFVRMIAVTGRIAMKNAEKRSDLDLFIILKSGRIFTGRTFVTLLVHLMGKRRYGSKIANRICLNYFIAEDSLEIAVKDLFASSEYFFIVPVFGEDVFKKFQKDNIWIKEYHGNFAPNRIGNLKTSADTLFSKTIRRLCEKIFSFDIFENNLKKWQKERIEKDPRTHQEGSMVMADEHTLVFLPNPHGPKVYEKFREKMEKLGS